MAATIIMRPLSSTLLNSRRRKKQCIMIFMYSFQKLWLKTFTRDDIWWGKLNLKNLKKEIEIIWSRDGTRPPLFENWNRRFPPLAKQIAPLSVYQNIVPTKCLRNQLGMVRSITIGRCNWCSLTSASPPPTKIIDRRKTFIDLASFRLFLQEDY